MSQFTNITKNITKIDNWIQPITKILIAMANVPIHKYYKNWQSDTTNYKNINSYGKSHNSQILQKIDN